MHFVCIVFRGKAESAQILDDVEKNKWSVELEIGVWWDSAIIIGTLEFKDLQ